MQFLCLLWYSPSCNTSVLTSFALNVYDIYIVINHGVELKAKIPTMDYNFMFWQLKSLPMVFCASRARDNYRHNLHMHFN